MRVVAIVQARMGSTRLPNKVMKLINGMTVIEILLKRLSKSKFIDEIIVATSDNKINDTLSDHINSNGIICYRGSEDNVLERFVKAGKGAKAEIAVRITGDCPLIDPKLVDKTIKYFIDSKKDYVSNCVPPTFPDGLDVEVFNFNCLERALSETKKDFDKEHVTPYLRDSGLFSVGVLKNSKDFSSLRWTLDEPEDFEVISNVVNHFYPDIFFSWKEVIKLVDEKPNLFIANEETKRNEGAEMGKGQKLYKRAKKIIPGGNMLLSKRPEMYLPEKWPSYFSKSKGCTVWDLEGNSFIDMSIMGIGTNILGYGNEEVDDAVQKTVMKGNMSTFNCPEEVYLAEKLIEMHSWSDMARFARSGGEANAIAIRIARAASGKENVAICGYHGWHDWYLAANLDSKESLSGHLLPGLNTKGVPSSLEGTVYPFQYNDFTELEKLVRDKSIGVIKMEVIRNMGPEDNFLEKVRKLATDNNIVLIFDECTSGFRETFGGIHKKYKVEPDMAMFGKALGNGYAITAILGKQSIMESAQESFISSTFWTERIGPSAALKTLEVMEKTKSWELITKTGEDIHNRWNDLADNVGLDISYFGIPALTGFSFTGENAAAYKTFLTQEMLKKGFLASNSVYVCTEHTPEIVHSYFEELEPIFATIKACDDGDNDIFNLLEGPVCHAGFKRLN